MWTSMDAAVAESAAEPGMLAAPFIPEHAAKAPQRIAIALVAATSWA